MDLFDLHKTISSFTCHVMNVLKRINHEAPYQKKRLPKIYFSCCLVPLFANEPFNRQALYRAHESNRTIGVGKGKPVAIPYKETRKIDRVEQLLLEE